MVKGIITEKINAHEFKVRIPVIHGIAASAHSTPDRDLPIASVCSPPGYTFNLALGDVVYVDFEINQTNAPVIVGILSRAESSSTADLKCDSLNVGNTCLLPQNVIIEKYESAIAMLQEEINNLKAQIAS